MAIKNWHYGKIILMWLLTVGLAPFLFIRFEDHAGWAIPLIMASVVTWIWFSGKE